MLNPPEREEYVIGSIVKAGKKIYDKASRKARSELDKAQGITSESPGRTAESRGAVIGKDRTKAFKNTEQIVGGAKTAAVVIPTTAIATAWMSKDNKGKPPSAFEKAFSKAHNAGENTFIFKGEVYSTEVRKGKAKGGYNAVQGYKDMYSMFERSLASAETEEQRRTIEANFIKETSNVSDMTKMSALKEMEKERMAREGKAEGGKFPDLTGDGEVTQADVLKGRGVFNEGGSMMMPPEGMPVDTYSNIPEDEMDEALASQLPDDEMEEDYIKYVMDESLNDEEQMYLAGALQDDDRLSDILDKVIATASEFSGAGEVDGPGTGVSDSIPARLSDGEFVFTKKATDQIGADQLQTMMDDAERAYDGGVMMAEGGMMDEEDPGMSKTKEEIEKLMMGANRMPSLR